MKFIFLASIAVVFSHLASGQQLSMYPTFGGAHFEFEKDTMVYQVSPRQVGQILFEYPDAYSEFKKARRNSTIAGIMGFAGAGLIIVPLASVITGADPEWAMAAGGAALIIGSIPLSTNYRMRAQNAVDMYNQRKASMKTQTRLHLHATGASLIIKF